MKLTSKFDSEFRRRLFIWNEVKEKCAALKEPYIEAGRIPCDILALAPNFMSGIVTEGPSFFVVGLTPVKVVERFELGDTINIYDGVKLIKKITLPR